MRPWRLACAAVLALCLGACGTDEPLKRPPAHEPPKISPADDPKPSAGTRDFGGGLSAIMGSSRVRDSVYAAVDRTTAAPTGYGLYTVLLARGADRNTLAVLQELLGTTVESRDAALPRDSLNLITLPVKQVAEARKILAGARAQPGATAGSLMQNAYDYGQASLLLASVCHPARGAAVMKACGSQSPDGPLLVTALKPLDREPGAGQQLLVVNLSGTQPEAVREVMAAYRRQLQRADIADGAEIYSWRLVALNHLLGAAKMLPGISKAYAAVK